MEAIPEKTVRWGILGTALIARVCLIPAIKKATDSCLLAIGSRSLDKAGELAAANQIPRAYGSYQDLIDDPDVDAVYVPLPNHLHREWTLKALAAGKHVLCEKPLALNAVEAGEMAAEAANAGRVLMEGLMYRFHPRSRRIKALVDSGEIGDPKIVRAAFCFVNRDRDNIRFRPPMGGGALMDVGCYGVSVARWILGDEPLEVQAFSHYGPTGVDLTTIALLRFPRDRFASIEASFNTGLQQTYTIAGTEKVIDLPHDAFIPWEKDAIFTVRGAEDETGVEHRVKGADEYQLMVEHFVDVVQGRAILEAGPEFSVANMKVLDAIAKAARESPGQVVTVL